MKIWNVILGVDVSNLADHIDICWAEAETSTLKLTIAQKDLRQRFKKWCKTHGIDLKETLMVMEFTGGYEYRFIQFCESLSNSLCQGAWSWRLRTLWRMTRGKNDKADAFRIRRYGEKNSDKHHIQAIEHEDIDSSNY